MTTLSPGSSWDGTTSWSGRTTPTESSTLRGSGWHQQAIGAFNRAPCLWWADDFTVVVGAEHGDDDWIEEVEFWLEGNTATVSSATKDSHADDIGFVVTIQPPSGTDGDAELYATIRPQNGYERVIGPCRMTLNKRGSITRTTFYLDPVGGDDNTGTGEQGAPWKSVKKACTDADDGSIVEMAAGTYLEDSNAGTLNQNARLIEFRKAAGLDVDDVTISRTSRTSNSGAWQIRAEKVLFDEITIDLGKMVQIQPANSDSVCVFKDCVLADPDGEDGPDDDHVEELADTLGHLAGRAA